MCNIPEVEKRKNQLKKLKKNSYVIQILKNESKNKILFHLVAKARLQVIYVYEDKKYRHFFYCLPLGIIRIDNSL